MSNKELIKKYADLDYPTSKSMNDYILKTTFDVVELSDNSLVRLEKTSIETHFCFGYGYCGISDQEDEERASEAARAAENYNYFLNANTKDIQETISMLRTGKMKSDSEYTPGVNTYIGKQQYNNKLAYISFIRPYDYETRFQNQNLRLATEEEKENLISAYTELLANKTKRCEIWWKRYGADHLHTWTYLSD